MPISDEIIELAPVKKTKSKLIVMFVIMGVLLALAVTFLVLFLLKPSVEDIDGRVNGVSVESSSLFAPSASGEDGKLYASVGNPYTVYVNVSAEGEADSEVNWDFSPNTAVADVTSGKVEGSDNRYYCTFTPLASYADNDQPITITARSKSDTTKTSQVVFYAVNQGTEDIRFIEYWANRNPAPPHTKLDNGNLAVDLTFYKTSLGSTKNNVMHFITFEQLGAAGATAGEYSKITLTGIGSDSPSNKISVVSSKPDVVEVSGISENASTPYFGIIAKGVSDEPVVLTITANVNNNSDPVEKKIKVNVKSNEQLGIINNIFVYDELVDAEFFAQHTNSNGQLTTGLPAEMKSLTLAYKSSYDDILSHVLLDPASLQYDKENGLKKTDWYKKLTVTSTNESVIAVKTADDGKVTLEARDLASAGATANKCSIVIADKNNPSIRKDIPVKVVAQNQSGAELSVVSSNTTYNNDTIIELNKKGDGIPTSPKIVSYLTVTYKLTAPANAKAEELVSNEYLSLGFDVEYDTDIFTVKILNSDVKDLKIKKFSDKSLTCKHVAGENFIATATFDIAVNADVLPDVYTVIFKKVGTSIEGADAGTVNKYDRDFSMDVNFNVSTIATRAEFKKEADAAEIINKLHTGYLVPSTVRAEELESGKTVYKQDANLYLQNCAENTSVMFLEELITTNGSTNRIESSKQYDASGALKLTTSNKKVNVSFLGVTTYNEKNVQATILYSVYDNAGEVIAELTLSIYVFNAYNSLSLVIDANANPDVVYYDADNFASFARDSLKVGRVFGADENYEMKDEDIKRDIYLGYGNNNYFDRTVENNGDIVYSYNGDALFTYNQNSNRYTANVDLFEYSYNNDDKIDFSKLFIEYRVRTEHYHEHLSNIEVASCSRQFKFIRKADGVKVFSELNEGKELSDAGGKLILPVQRGERSGLYPSAVVDIKVDGTAKSITVLFDDNARSAVETVYVELGTEAIADITAIDPSSELFTEHGYTALSFRAPAIDSNQKDYSVRALGAATKSIIGQDIIIRVLNQARTITQLDLYSNDSYTQKLTALDFGKYNVGAGDGQYDKIIYIQATYEAKKAEHTKFEPISVVLPDYLLYSTDGSDYKDAQSKAISLYNGADISSNAPAQLTLYLRLKSDATATAGDARDIVSVRAEYDTTGTTADREKRASVSVGTGLGSLVLSANGNALMTVGAGETKTYNHTFALKNATDAQALKLDLGYVALTKDFGDGNIVYDGKNITVSSDAVSGLTLESGNVNGENPYVTLGVSLTALKTMSGVPFTITFTDKANGSAAAFKATINVTVTMDIFALAPDASSYSVTTTGGDSGVQTVNGAILFNNDVADIKPDALDIDYTRLQVKVVDAQGNAVTAVTAVKAADNKSFTLSVPNNILTGLTASGEQNYFVKLVYGDVESTPVPLVITTSAMGIRAADGNDVTVAGGKGEIVVKNETVGYKLAVTVFNLGTDAPVGESVVYKLYSDAARTSESGIAQIDGNGNITFKAGAQTLNHGVLYYRATGGGVNFDVDLKYAFDVKSVALDDAVLTDGKIVLYYDNTNCTTLNLEKHIAIKSVFGIDGLPEGATVTVTSNGTDKLAVNGYTLTPKSLGVTGIDISVKRGDTVAVMTYAVEIIELRPTITPSVATLNIVDANSLTVTIGGEYSAFDSVFVVTNKNVYTAIGNTVTIDRSKLAYAAGSGYADITISATVTYTLADGSLLGMNGVISKRIDCIVHIVGEYAFDFDLTADGVALSADSAFVNGAAYAVEIASPKTSGDWKYTATVTPQVGTVGAFANGKATFAFGGSSFGRFDVIVTAEAYGKKYVQEKTYTVNNGNGATATMSYTKDGAETTLDKAIETAVPSEGVTLTYKIDASKVTTADIAADAVGVLVAGDVTVGEIQKSGNVFTVTLTPNVGAGASSKLIVSGKFTVGGITYYTDEYKVRLTATAPEFAFASVADKLVMGDSVAFVKNSIENSASGFVGDYSVEYSIVSGSAYASIAGGVLTASDSLSSDKTVTVRATVTVSGGAFDKSVYLIDKQITIVVPTVEWIVGSKTVNVGGSVSVDSAFGSGMGGITGYETEYSYKWTAPVEFTTGDYVANGKTLSVAASDRTKAGGRFAVTVTMSVKKDGVELCSVRSSGALSVVIVPTTAKAVEYSVFGAAGSYNIKNAVAPYTLNGEGHIKADDDYVVSYTLGVGSTLGGVAVSGDILTLSQNAFDKGVIKLSATVTVTTGAYKGYVLTCDDVTVNVFGRKLTDTTAALNADGTAYDKLSAASMVGGSDIRGIKAVALTNGAFVTVYGNNTADPQIEIDLDANVVGGANSVSDIVFGFEVTKNDGTVEYVVGKVYTVAITPVLEYTMASGSATLDSLQSFVIELSEAHGLEIANVTAHMQTSSGLLAYTVSGDTVELTASVVTVVNSDTLVVSATVGGVVKTVEIPVTVNPINVTVSFETNGGATIADKTFVYGETYGALDLPAKAGYDFDGWYTAEGKRISNALGASSEQIISSAAHTLYARWLARSIEVTLIVADGSVNPNKITVTFGETYAELNNVTVTPNDGYRFDGWYYGDVRITETTKVADDTLTTLVARMTQITYGVTLVANGGTFDDGSTVKVVNIVENGAIDESYKPSHSNPSHTFKGWFTGTDASATEVTEITEDIVVYAQWNVNECTVTYSGNVTGCSSGTVKVDYGTPVSSLKVPYPSSWLGNYTFTGWFKTDNSPAPETITEDIELVAHFTKSACTVTLNANGGTVGGLSEIKLFGAANDSIELPNPDERAGYTFDGWYNGSKQVTSPVTIKGNMTLEARWTAKSQFTVTYKHGYGSVADTVDTYYAGDTVTVTYAPTRTGYVFDGWYNGGTKVTSPFEITANVTLTAKWNIVKYTLTLDAGENGTVYGLPTVALSVEYGTEFSLPVPVKEGYTHVWKNGGVTVGDKITVDGDITLVAEWTEKATFTVSFDSNYGATSDRINATYYVGETVNELYVPSERTGYTFDGWYANAATTGDRITTVTAATTLYAKWTPISCVITLDANGGTVSGLAEITLSGMYDATIALPTPEYAGYDFKGWQVAGGASYTDAYDVKGDVTLTARWERKTLTITIMLGYDGKSVDTNIQGASAMSDVPATVVRDGFVLEGLYYYDTSKTDGYGDKYDSELLYEDTVLIAKWTPAP